MLKNYFKLTIRNLSRHKLFALVNLGGLIVGMSACIMIMLYVGFELSYDRFHARSEDIYRIRMDQWEEGRHVYQRAKAFGVIGPALESEFPEIQEAARLINLHGIMGNFVMSYKDAKFTEEKVYYADAAILNLFSFNLLEGEAQQALTQPHTIVITSSFAKKYFGEEPAMGKSLIMNGDEAFLVTGILEDVPKNSHLQFDFLLSFETLKSQEFMLGWADFLTYVLLQPGVNGEQLNAKLISSNPVAKLLGRESAVQLSLQPLHDIHLNSHMEGEAEANGSAMITYGLLIVAFLILVIAWMNYVNLTTARSLDRAKEVGIRKTVGAERGDLIRQFLTESVILNGVAVLAALLLVAELLPLFNRIFGTTLTFSAYGRFELWGLLLAFFIAGSLASSLYPAFVMSSFQPIKTLKGQFQLLSGKLTLRKVLVVYQFAASIVLIAGTWAVFRQLAFMRHQELGVNIEQTLIVKAPSIADSTYSERLNSFKSELLRYEAIQSLTSSTNIPGRESTWGGTVRRYGDARENAAGVDFTGIDYDFVSAYGMKLLAGRNFSKDFSSDQSAALANEAALRLLRYDNPEEIIGQKIIAWRGAEVQVVGVLQTHHQLSLQHQQPATVFFLRPAGGNFYAIKFKTADLAGTIGRIQSEYEKLFSGNPFEYFFLDEYFNRQYQADQRFGQIFGLFAGLAIVIACLGLFALSAFSAMKRTKEIGIRKVLGATTPNLVMLLSKDFLLLLSLANLFALPLAGIIIKKWLENYAFRINLGWDMFAIPAFIVAAIALITVSTQAIKAALTNPVEALRYE